MRARRRLRGFIFLAAFGLGFGALLPAAEALDVEYFKKQIEPYRKLPEFVAPGPPFDARKCMQGKSILSIPVSSANPFTKNIEDAMSATAKRIGFKFIEWENQGQPSQWLQGMDHAISQKVNLIDLLAGTKPEVLGAKIDEARQAGITVVASHLSGYEQDLSPLKVHSIPIDYFKAGQLLVDWAVVQTGGKLNAIVLTSEKIHSTISMVNGITTEFKKCAECRWKEINIPVVDWATRIQPNVQSALLADPTINYIIVIYDSMAQFVVPAVTITGSQNRVRIDAFNGTPFVLGLVQQGQVEMDIGENLDWIGHAIIDAEMRLICGLPPVKDPKIPFYIFDKSNAHRAGNPPELSKGYGDAYIDGYLKLWRLK